MSIWLHFSFLNITQMQTFKIRKNDEGMQSCNFLGGTAKDWLIILVVGECLSILSPKIRIESLLLTCIFKTGYELGTFLLYS
jgi:hypothetical protein